MLTEHIPFRIFPADLTAIIVASFQLLGDEAMNSITLSTAMLCQF
jgi:hypothetical protein